MNWTQLVAAVSYWSQQEQPDASFTLATPAMVQKAELRIYRDLPFLAFNGTNEALQTTAFSRVVDLTAIASHSMIDGSTALNPWPLAVESISAKVGNRWFEFSRASRHWIDLVWPDLTVAAAPSLACAYFDMEDDRTAIIAPVPDAKYPLRVRGIWRPAPMSASNPQTWLGDNLPDILLDAVMCEVTGYQRDFGAQSDDPRMAVSWESKYQAGIAKARAEDALRKGIPTSADAPKPPPQTPGT